jgi:hypothetical protein
VGAAPVVEDAGREDLPVGAQGVDVAVGDAAVEVGVQVVQVLGLAGVDVARDVEVVVVGFGSAISASGTMRE